jgi:Cu-Zn family superoxide dismutase
VAVFAMTALATGGAVASAHDGGGDAGGARGDSAKAPRLFTLQPDPAANPEGIAVDADSHAFFVSITGDGAIYRGTLDSDRVTPFIAGAPGKVAVGIKVHDGKLYVAGGTTGTITVYDLATKKAVATFATGTGGFLNDLVVTGRGDVFVTDSFRPTLWHVTADQVKAGGGTVQALDVSAGITFQAGFNLNGIVARGSRSLIVVQTNTGKLFRIRLNADASAIDKIREIGGVSVPGGDGLLLDRGRLVVVQGGPPAQLSLVALSEGARHGVIRDTLTSPTLNGPSTVDRADGVYLVVNADFAHNARPFTVAGLPRPGGGDGGDD